MSENDAQGKPEHRTLELENLNSPSLCHSAHQGCAGIGRQRHLLKAKYWIRDKVIKIECKNEMQV